MRLPHAGVTRLLMAAAGLMLVALPAGCALRPAGERPERQRAMAMGEAFHDAATPELPTFPTQEDYLYFAFHNNATLRMRYWEWRATLEQVPRASSWPRLAIGFDVMFTRESMKLWDRTTLMAASDPMAPIPFPTKLRRAGRIALENARAAGARFEKEKFLLQERVLSTYYDLALLAESFRIQRENVTLLEAIAQQASARVSSGSASQQELLRAHTDLDLARNELENLRARVAPTVAKMNAILGRPVGAPVPLPTTLPEPRALPVADDALIQIGSERSSELTALAHEVAGQQEALALARQAYLPDFSLSASITGSLTRSVGAMLMLPTQLESIRAGIAQARANIAAAEAARTQYARDLAASFVLNLYVLRNDERQIELFDNVLIPRLEQTVTLAATEYSTGRLAFIDLLAVQRALLDAQLVRAELRTEREKALAAIETWSAMDAEAMPRRAMSTGGMGEGSAAPMGMEASGGGGM